MSLPVIAVTVGDPSGIGPEIAVKADRAIRASSRPAVRVSTVRTPPPTSPRFRPDTSAPSPRGRRTTRSSAPWRTRATGRAAAIATAPVNKDAFAAAGLPWRGHTDLLAHLCGVDDVAMLFWSDRLRVVLATVHIPLAEVPQALTTARLLAVIRLTARSLPRFGVARAPAGGGRTQSSRRRERRARPRGSGRPRAGRRRRAADGIDVTGPLPADTLFVRAARGEFDVVDRRVPRSGSGAGEAARVRAGGERHARVCRSSARRSITARRSTSRGRAWPTRAVWSRRFCWPRLAADTDLRVVLRL